MPLFYNERSCPDTFKTMFTDTDNGFVYRAISRNAKNEYIYLSACKEILTESKRLSTSLEVIFATLKQASL